jgi:hypothetical protein
MGRGKLFITLFRAELEDAVEGLEQLSQTMEKRLHAGEITNYVFNENTALLANEISSIKNLIPLLDTVDYDSFENCEALVKSTGNMLQMKAELMDDPHAVVEIIIRKLKKVMAYLEGQPG